MKITNNAFNDINNGSYSIIYGVVFGIIVTILFSMISALLLQYSIISTSSMKIVSIINLFIGGFFCGYITAKKNKHNGMYIGMLSGIFLLFFVISLGLLFQTVSFGLINLSLFLVKFFGLALMGSIAGIIGVNTINNR